MHTRRDRAPSGPAASVLALSAALALSGLMAACRGGAAADGARAPSEVRGVEAAGLPFRVLRARGGQEIGWDAFLAEVGGADAVCVGENHRNPHDHWAQLHLFDALSARSRAGAVTIALGMEMFQRPFQGVLDDFAARRIEEAALLSRTAWKERWGFDWSLYRPMVFMARDRGAAILALNIPRELTRKVARRGVDKLDPAERGKLPELVLDDAEHRAWWDAIMEEMGAGEGHGHAGASSGEDEDGEDEDGEDEDGETSKPDKPSKAGKPGKPSKAGKPSKGKNDKDAEEKAEADARAEASAAGERMYTAQVLWDESMAESASAWLTAGRSAGARRRQIVILAGNGHCHESAIVRRMKRRGVRAAVSVRPIIDDGEGGVAALLAAPENDYLFVMTPPAH